MPDANTIDRVGEDRRSYVLLIPDDRGGWLASRAGMRSVQSDRIRSARVPLTALMTLKVVDPKIVYVSPDPEGRGHDYSRDEPDDRASEGGRKPDFGGGKRSSRRVGEQANDQSGDPASHSCEKSGNGYPSSKHRHAAYPVGERLHTQLSHVRRRTCAALLITQR
jgi:hypothetical protein